VAISDLFLCNLLEDYVSFKEKD